MKLRAILLAFAFCFAIITSCKYFQPTAYIYISNQSRDKKAVDISISLDNENVFSDTIKWTNVAPDLQYSVARIKPKGKYILKVVADSGKLKEAQEINLDKDKWVFVTYTYEAPIDSSTLFDRYGFLINATGYIDSSLSKKLKGIDPTVLIYVKDEEPIFM
jgi:hypothetical protein